MSYFDLRGGKFRATLVARDVVAVCLFERLCQVVNCEFVLNDFAFYLHTP